MSGLDLRPMIGRKAGSGKGAGHRRRLMTLAVAMIVGIVPGLVLNAPFAAASAHGAGTRATAGRDSGPTSESNADPIAYVVNDDDPGSVTPIDTVTDTPETPIPVGGDPTDIAITPDGTTAYVSTDANESVTAIDTATNTAGTPIPLRGADAIAITPDGTTAYVTNIQGPNYSVTPIDLATNTAGTPILVGGEPDAIAITPDGTTAYVSTNGNSGSFVTPIDTGTNTSGTPIPVDEGAVGIAITPDGSTAYVTSYSGDDVTPIDIATDTAETPVPLDGNATDIAITPDGSTAYVSTNGNSGSFVTPIDTATNTAGTPIPVDGAGAAGIVITPDGKTAYVAMSDNYFVTLIDTDTNTAGASIGAGDSPQDIAITPDQAPEAELEVNPAPPGSPTDFDASGSVAPSSPIASYAWDFGDGTTETTTTPTTSHTYATSGDFTATVTETDTAGTSTDQVFTGQTVSRNGGPSATASQTIEAVDCSADDSCSAEVTDGPLDSRVGGTSSTDGTLSVSLGNENVSCGDDSATESEPVTSYTTTDYTGSALSATLTVANDTATDGAVCYSSPTPFIDNQGDSVTSGELPDCSVVEDVAPCIVSITSSDGNLVIDLLVPPGDPSFWTAPVLSSFTPTKAPVGTKVTIVGGPFAGASKVEFGGVPARFKVKASGTKITAVVPVGAKSGPITAFTPDGEAVSSKHFKVTKSKKG
jgi:YVTN family beta-propeller protein